MRREDAYGSFVEEWQDEYGPRPSEYVPDEDSEDFKLWCISNSIDLI